MDEIQKILIQAGRKDLAQKYYKKVAARPIVMGDFKRDSLFKSLDKEFSKLVKGTRVTSEALGFELTYDIKWISEIEPSIRPVKAKIVNSDFAIKAFRGTQSLFELDKAYSAQDKAIKAFDKKVKAFAKEKRVKVMDIYEEFKDYGVSS